MKRGDMTDGIFKEFAPTTIAAIEALEEYRRAREEDAKL